MGEVFPLHNTRIYRWIVGLTALIPRHFEKNKKLANQILQLLLLLLLFLLL